MAYPRDEILKDQLASDWFAYLNDRKAKGTAELYLTYFHRYWADLSKSYPDLSAWVRHVREQTTNPDVKVATTWAVELERWLLERKLSGTVREIIVAAVKSFLGMHVALSKYQFITEKKAEKKDRIRREREIPPVTLDEWKTLALAANSTYRAIMLSNLSAGMGVGEFSVFESEWHKYADAIRRNDKVPIRIDLIRPKTDVVYWNLLWDDALQSLHDLLLERERELGRQLTAKDHLFVNQNGNPITTTDIQEEVRDLADRTGLDPKVKGRRGNAYRIRPHELRDTFKTVCSNSRIDNDISEFGLGHEVDPLLYNKFARTQEGEELIRLQLSKARARLNIISGKGQIPIETGTAYFETTLDVLALAKGIAYHELKDRLVAFAKRTATYKEHEARMKDSPPLEIVRTFSRDELRPSVDTLVQSLIAVQEAAKPEVPDAPKWEQKVIPADDLQKWIDDGWEFLSVVNGTRVVIRRVKAS